MIGWHRRFESFARSFSLNQLFSSGIIPSESDLAYKTCLICILVQYNPLNLMLQVVSCYNNKIWRAPTGSHQVSMDHNKLAWKTCCAQPMNFPVQLQLACNTFPTRLRASNDLTATLLQFGGARESHFSLVDNKDFVPNLTLHNLKRLVIISLLSSLSMVHSSLGSFN